MGKWYEIYDVDEDYFEFLTPESSYILGYITADGDVRYKPYMLRISSKDKDMLESIKNRFAVDCPIRKEYSTFGSCYRLQVSRKKIVLDLAKFGIIPNKSKTIKFPTNIPSELLVHYIRGYFDGDGCVCRIKSKYGKKNPRFAVSFVSGSKDYLEGLKKVSYKIMGFESNITKKEGNCWMLFAKNFASGVRFYNSIYENSTIYLPRKKSIFENILSSRSDDAIVQPLSL